MRAPYVIYADFESITQKNESNQDVDSEGSYTTKYKHYKPWGFCIHVESLTKYKSILYREDDAALVFVKTLEKLAKTI